VAVHRISAWRSRCILVSGWKTEFCDRVVLFVVRLVTTWRTVTKVEGAISSWEGRNANLAVTTSGSEVWVMFSLVVL